MRKVMLKYYLLFTCIVQVILISAQNNMPLMQSFKGRAANSWFGKTMTTIDFNTDGFDDLVVYSQAGVSNAYPRIDIFLGGSPMDTIPDFSKISQFWGQNLDTVLINTGDLNGDGYDDLMTMETFENSNDSCQLDIYYGGPNADLIPDNTITTPLWGINPKIMPRCCLGDVNGDGYDDLGIWYWNNHLYPDLAILLGGTYQIITIQQSITGGRRYSITGSGDVNGDGYNDFLVGYALNVNNVITTYRYLYHGGNPFDLDNRVLLRELADTGEWDFPGGYGIGDFNGDGYDDFVYCNGQSYRDNNKLRLGGIDILSTLELTLHCNEYLPNLMDMRRQGIAYGDFNGDGYSDIAGSDFEVMTWTGDAGVWLGGANPNGLYDLVINTLPTSPYHQFGWQLDSGDFNGDGYCDLAISAPQMDGTDPFYHGYVYIFNGNSQLTDTTASEDDYNNPPVHPNVWVKYYPNPISAKVCKINFEIYGKLPHNISSASIILHNIKGQLVKKAKINLKDLGNRTGELSLTRLMPGFYLSTLVVNGENINTEKVLIK